jgi:hypothetical protein
MACIAADTHDRNAFRVRMPVWGHKAHSKPQAKTQMHLTSLSPETAEKVLITNHIKALFLPPALSVGNQRGGCE